MHKQPILAVSFSFAANSFGRTAQPSGPTSFQLLRLECSLSVWYNAAVLALTVCISFGFIERFVPMRLATRTKQSSST